MYHQTLSTLCHYETWNVPYFVIDRFMHGKAESEFMSTDRIGTLNRAKPGCARLVFVPLLHGACNCKRWGWGWGWLMRRGTLVIGAAAASGG